MQTTIRIDRHTRQLHPQREADMNVQTLNVTNLPRFVSERELAGSAVVVIDVLRATTTICQALASGAKDVTPFVEVEEARAAAAAADRAEIVLGGERQGKRIDGFDLGNSPAEYTRAAVAGRRVLMTTTNGTRALRHAHLAGRVLVGAVVNLSAVVASVKDEPRVDILCAGTDGFETGEDILAAGGMVEQLCRTPSAIWRLNDAAVAACREWERIVAKAQAADCTISEELANQFREAPGGRNLLQIGLDRDLVDCAQVDRLSIVPALNVKTWRIGLE
jgi:2-phosphosulfolactate phosphatase